MLDIVAIGSVVLSLFSPLPVAPARAPKPPPDGVVIDVVKVNGSGCRPHTASVAVSPDNTAFTVTYSEYLAQVGVGAKPNDYRKNCKLDLRVSIPKGFTYAISQADYRGFMHLERGATALESATYHFQASQQRPYVDHGFSGPVEDDWQTTDAADSGALAYAPCGKVHGLNIDTDLSVSAGTSNPNTTTSSIAMDSTDGSIDSIYHLAWKQCS